MWTEGGIFSEAQQKNEESQVIFRTGNSGALSVVTENKRLTRLFSGEYAVERKPLAVASS